MKHKKWIALAFLLSAYGGLHAQEATLAAGGEVTGSGGTGSYTVGQVVYRAYTGSNGSVSPALLSVYNVSTVSISEASIDIELSTYPNPTAHNLTLKVDKIADLTYHLYNMNGELVESKKVSEHSTFIEMQNLLASTYILKVTKNKQAVKTFQIIKTN